MQAMYWLILLAVLLIIEIATMGLTTIWFAGGAFIGFIASLLQINDFIQFVLFFIVSFVLLYFTRPIAVKYFNSNRTKTNYEDLIGKEARVVTKIDNFNQSGSVILNGLEWTARTKEDGKIIMPDTNVTVLKISGVKLIVTDKKEEV